MHGIALAQDLNKGFTSNGTDGTVTVFDLATLKTRGTIATAAKNPDGIAYDPVTKRVFTLNGSGNDATVIDAQTDRVVATIPPGGRPAMDEAHRRLFTACQGEMGIVDADSGKVIATVPTGAGTDATRFDANTGFAFASNGRSATLTVVHEDDPDRFSVAQNAQTVAGARTMALDSASGNVFLVTAKLIENQNATSYRDRYKAVPGTFELLVVSP